MSHRQKARSRRVRSKYSRELLKMKQDGEGKEVRDIEVKISVGRRRSTARVNKYRKRSGL